MLVIAFAEKDTEFIQEIIDLISYKTGVAPMLIQKQNSTFNINPYTRTFTNEKGKQINLTANIKNRNLNKY